jgi:DNA invertase Pin-like site-specific DNA recombinase
VWLREYLAVTRPAETRQKRFDIRHTRFSLSGHAYSQFTGEGRARAKARGVTMGRKPKLTPHQQAEARQRRVTGKDSIRGIARSYNVHNSTISRLTA